MSVYQSWRGLAESESRERGAVTSLGGGQGQTEKCAIHGEVKLKLLSQINYPSLQDISITRQMSRFLRTIYFFQLPI